MVALAYVSLVVQNSGCIRSGNGSAETPAGAEAAFERSWIGRPAVRLLQPGATAGTREGTPKRSLSTWRTWPEFRLGSRCLTGVRKWHSVELLGSRQPCWLWLTIRIPPSLRRHFSARHVLCFRSSLQAERSCLSRAAQLTPCLRRSILAFWPAMMGASGHRPEPVSAPALLFPLPYLRGPTAKAAQQLSLQRARPQAVPFIRRDVRLRRQLTPTGPRLWTLVRPITESALDAVDSGEGPAARDAYASGLCKALAYCASHHWFVVGPMPAQLL